MLKKTLCIAVAATTALSAFSVSANAKDWIESVQVSRDGIDIKPIQVRAGGSGYSSVRTEKHRFSLLLYARATSGERIVGAKLASYNNVHYFEADGGKSIKTYNWRAVGSGSKRTWQTSDSLVVPVSKLTFVGKDPVAACNALMATKMNQGMSRPDVWAKSWITSTKVMFQLDAVAARKGKAAKNQVSVANTSSERSTGYYDVRVECMPKPKRATN